MAAASTVDLEAGDLEAGMGRDVDRRPSHHTEESSGQGSGATVSPEGGEEKKEDDTPCKPGAFICAMPFLLLGILLYPFGLVFKVLKCVCCCAPGGCCMSCIFGAAECLTELPCKIYSCFKTCIPC